MKITGKHLIELGYRPGKWFKDALTEINQKKLQGEDLLNYISTVAPRYVEPFNQPKPFHQNILATSETEAKNLESVISTMNQVLLTPTVIRGAIMPDSCPTGPLGQIPVGAIVQTEDAIHPSMHSADICCSVMMTSYGTVDPKKVLDVAHQTTHFGPGGRDDLFKLPKELEAKILGNRFLNNEKSISLAKSHLGTQGDGNHFLYVGQSEKTGETTMVTHHGSRGFGAYLYTQGMRVAEKYRIERSPKTLKNNAWIPYSEDHGKEYWEALQIVREWTKLNHKLIHQKTCQRLGIDPVEQFWNEHNFVFKEENTFYHAKGATPLDDKFVPDSKDGLRLIPLNMSEPILVVKGNTTETNLGFAPHGAGRNISRSQHKRNNQSDSIEKIFARETAGLDVRFYSGHIDISELPSAYKNAQDVKEQMKTFDLGEVVDEILPYGCIMAGDWQKDAPWKKRKKKK